MEKISKKRISFVVKLVTVLAMVITMNLPYAQIHVKALPLDVGGGPPDQESTDFSNKEPVFTTSKDDVDPNLVVVEVEFPDDSVLNETRVDAGEWTPYVGPLTFDKNVVVEARGFNAGGEESKTAVLAIDSFIDESKTPDEQSSVDEGLKEEPEIDTPETEEVVEEEEEEEVVEVPEVIVDGAPVISLDATYPTSIAIATIDYDKESIVREYRLNDGAWQPYTETLLVEANGTIEARGIDKDGNRTETTAYKVSNIIDESIVLPRETQGTKAYVEPLPADFVPFESYKHKIGQEIMQEQMFSARSMMKTASMMSVHSVPRTWDKIATITRNHTLSWQYVNGGYYGFGGDNWYEIKNGQLREGIVIPQAGQTGTKYTDLVAADINTYDYELVIKSTSGSPASPGAASGSGNWSPWGSTEFAHKGPFAKTSPSPQLNVPYSLNEDNRYYLGFNVSVKDASGNVRERVNATASITFDVMRSLKQAPPAPTFTQSTTAPTTQNVTVTMVDPVGATGITKRDYRINGGAWTNYTAPFTVSSNATIEGRVHNGVGPSPAGSINITNIDKVAPVITISGVVDGQSYAGKVTATVTFSDNLTPVASLTNTMLLDGQPYVSGTDIITQGSHTLVVTSKDQVGNTSTKTVTFIVNTKPVIVGAIPDSSLAKFGTKTIDLAPLFTNPQSGGMTFEADAVDPSIARVTITGSTLTVEALKQGNTVINIKSKNATSYSDILTMKVNIDNSAPAIAITNNQWLLAGDGDSVSIDGTVTDVDRDVQDIEGKLGGITVTKQLPSPSTDTAPWTLTFNTDTLASGIYAPLSVEVTDEFGAKDAVDWSKFVVRVSGSRALYESIITIYESDLGKSANDFTVAEHQALLDAYEAMKALENSNSNALQVDAETKVNALADGAVKNQYLSKIAVNSFEWLIANFDKATVADYVRANITNVTSGTLVHTNELGQEYLKDKPVLVHGDVILLGVVSNDFKDATTANTVTKWLDVKVTVEMLENGALETSLLDKINEGIFKALQADPASLTKELLKDHFNVAVTDKNLGDYKLYLADIAVAKPVITLTDLNDVVQSVDSVLTAYEEVTNNPTNTALGAYINLVEALVDGPYKTSLRDKYEAVRLLNFVTNPLDQKANDFTDLGVTIKPGNVPDYVQNIDSYIKSQGPAAVTITVIQDVVDVTDALLAYQADPKVDKLKDLVDALAKLDPNSELAKAIKKAMEDALIDSVNANLGNVTEDELVHLGVKDVDPSLIDKYQDALDEYSQTKSPLSLDDIQKVIDAINAVENAKANPTPANIKNGYDKVNLLEDGPLKDRLLQELEDITIGHITSNPGSVTVEDLEHANIKNVTQGNLDGYQKYLEDVLAAKSPVTKADIQDAIDTVNKLEALYQAALSNPTRVNADLFMDAVQALVPGTLQDEYRLFIPEVGWAHLVFAPGDQDDTTYGWNDLVHTGVNMDKYNNHLPTYVTDVTSNSITKQDVELFITAVDSYEVAYGSKAASDVAQAMVDIQALKDGVLKDLLIKTLIDELLSSLNGAIENATTEDLANIGIVNLDKNNEKEYQDALKQYQDDLKTPLTPEDIQAVVDAINGIVEAEKSPTRDNIKDALEAIEKLKDGKLKDDLMDRLRDVVVEFIDANIVDIKVEDLELIGIKDVDPLLLDEYKEYLSDYRPLTVEKIQQVINVTNLLQDALANVDQPSISAFDSAVAVLEASTLKTKLQAVEVVLGAIVAYETAPTTLTKDALTIAVQSVTTSNKVYIDEMVDSLELSITTALAPTDATVTQAVATIGNLVDGEFKTRLLEKVGEAYLEYVQQNPDKVTAGDLIKAGFERVVDSNINEYRDGLTSLTGELGKLDREVIQQVIDVVNGLEDDTVIKNLNKSKDLKKEIEKLPDSDWKKEKLKETSDIISKLTPSGSSSTTEEVKKPEESKGNVIVEGKNVPNGKEFDLNAGTIDDVIKGNKGIVAKSEGIEIVIPAGSIDFAKLQRELGKFGLIIQLIKLDEQNYKLVVKAITPEGEKELKNFEKHLRVSMKDAESGSVKTASVKETVVLRKEDGKLTAVPHQHENDTFTIRTTRTGNFVVVDRSEAFADTKNTFSKREIEQLANRNIVFGVSKTSFKPSNTITRAELAVMIARAMDLYPTKETPFTDIKGKWYEDQVQALFEAGIITGVSDTLFDPNAPVLRDQAAAMMARAIKTENGATKIDGKNLTFKDEDSISAYAKEGAALLSSLGIMVGADGYLKPKSKLTRAEMAKILHGTLRHIKYL